MRRIDEVNFVMDYLLLLKLLIHGLLIKSLLNVEELVEGMVSLILQ